MEVPKGNQTFQEELLHGEIAETKIDHISYMG